MVEEGATSTSYRLRFVEAEDDGMTSEVLQGRRDKEAASLANLPKTSSRLHFFFLFLHTQYSVHFEICVCLLFILLCIWHVCVIYRVKSMQQLHQFIFREHSAYSTKRHDPSIEKVKIDPKVLSTYWNTYTQTLIKHICSYIIKLNVSSKRDDHRLWVMWVFISSPLVTDRSYSYSTGTTIPSPPSLHAVELPGAPLPTTN
jgi:hypothetical protein